MLIVGINAFHGDSSACVVRDGKLIAAVEEERFRRIKHWAGFPAEAVRYCLREAGVALSDVAHVAINQNSRAHFVRKLAYFVGSRPDVRLVVDRLRTRHQREGVPELLAKTFPG